MDALSEVLKRFNVVSNVFFSGNLCNLSDFATEYKQGHIHVLRSGSLTLLSEEKSRLVIDEPTLLFFPAGRAHRIIPDPSHGADLVCASVEYQDANTNPVASALPSFMRFTLSEHQRLEKAADWLFDEAFSDLPGRLPMINRLCDIFIIEVLREVLANDTIQQGMLAGLSHPQLAKVISAIHSSPAKAWSLELMAELAFMSRSKFAASFREVLGETPGDYLNNWRMSLVQNALLKGESVSTIATDVGYENGSALARAFRKKFDMSPKQWQKFNRN